MKKEEMNEELKDRLTDLSSWCYACRYAAAGEGFGQKVKAAIKDDAALYKADLKELLNVADKMEHYIHQIQFDVLECLQLMGEGR